MGNYVFSTAFVTGTAIASSAQTAFPASNVLLYTRPQRCWKALGIGTSVYVGVNFGGPTTVAAIVVDDINVTGVAVERSSDGSSWTTIGSLTLNADPVDGRRKYYYPLAAFYYQYIRVRSTQTSTTDGSPYMRLGSLAVLASVTEWTHNPSGRFVWQPIQAVAEQRFGGGGAEPVALGPRGALVGFSAPVMPLASLTNLLTVAGYSYAQPLVFARNAANPQEVYICRRIGVTPIEYVRPNVIAAGDMMFEECS